MFGIVSNADQLFESDFKLSIDAIYNSGNADLSEPIDVYSNWIDECEKTKE
jgi:hypothetical protein